MSQGESIYGLGARTDWIAAVPHADVDRLELTPEEMALFSRIGRAAKIQEVLDRSGMSEPRAIATLLALRAKGAIAPAKVHSPPPAQDVSAALHEEVDLDLERKREILELERGLDTANHFEVLGLPPLAPVEEVRRAFYEASRKFHPDRYFGKDLGSFRARIERIFRRISEAYSVLSDYDKRARYLEAHPELKAPPAESARSEVGEAREAERRARFARHPYLAKVARAQELIVRAKGRLQRGEIGQAVADLERATQMDERNAEARTLLADARRKLEQQRAQEEMRRAEIAERDRDLETAANAYQAAASADPGNAAAAYHAARLMVRLGREARDSKSLAQRAVDLAPKNADYRVLLGVILEQAGMKALAKRQFEEALRLDPEHAEAKKHTRRRWPF